MNVLVQLVLAVTLTGCVDRALELDPAPPSSDFAVPVDFAIPADLARPPDFASTSSLVAFLEVPHRGGPVVATPNTVTIGWTDNQAKATLVDETFKAVFAYAEYWNGLMQYGVAGGLSNGVVILDESPPPMLTDDDIPGYLDARIAAGKLPTPDANTIYVFTPASDLTYFLKGQSQCSSWGGYHDSVVLNHSGLEVSYIVAVGCGGDDDLVYAATHELVEAATDPHPQTNPAYADADVFELNDICEDLHSVDVRNVLPKPKVAVAGIERPISLYYRNDRAHQGDPACESPTGGDVGDTISLVAEPLPVQSFTPYVPDATTAAKITVSMGTSTTTSLVVDLTPGYYLTCHADVRTTMPHANWADRLTMSVDGPNPTFSFVAQWKFRSVVRLDLTEGDKTHSYFIELIGPADPSL